MADRLKPCPFCGGQQLLHNESDRYGVIKCACGAKIECKDEPERYTHLIDEIYLRVPAKSGLEIAAEKWNRRVNDG